MAVDIRKGSPTFGQSVSMLLSEANKWLFFLPRGFAHGFVVFSDEAVFQYKCDSYYAPQSEGAVAWNDPVLHIDWNIPVDHIILSEKDKRNPLLSEAVGLFNYSDDLYA